MADPTHYDTLGLPADSTQDAIRKRYRALARQFHPDVARTPDAAARFKDINEAHRVLSDPDRRASYDAELKLARLRAERAERLRARQQSAQATPPGPGAAARPNGAPQPAGPSRAAGRSPGQGTPAAAPSAIAAQAVARAQRAIRQMRYREAELLCRHALRLDRRNATACELLGDIFRLRGRLDEANRYYSYAVQFDGRNTRVQEKIERLIRQSFGGTGGSGLGAASLRPVQALVGLVALLTLAILPVFFCIARPPRVETLLWPDWEPAFLGVLAATGLACGVLMSVNRLVGYARDEIAGPGGRSRGRAGLSAGLALLVLSLVSFYITFAAYALIGFTQETVSRSVIRALAATLVLIALFALLSQQTAPFILASAGSLIFPSVLAGWALGDALRQ